MLFHGDLIKCTSNCYTVASRGLKFLNHFGIGFKREVELSSYASHGESNLTARGGGGISAERREGVRERSNTSSKRIGICWNSWSTYDRGGNEVAGVGVDTGTSGKSGGNRKRFNIGSNSGARRLGGSRGKSIEVRARSSGLGSCSYISNRCNRSGRCCGCGSNRFRGSDVRRCRSDNFGCILVERRSVSRDSGSMDSTILRKGIEVVCDSRSRYTGGAVSKYIQVRRAASCGTRRHLRCGRGGAGSTEGIEVGARGGCSRDILGSTGEVECRAISRLVGGSVCEIERGFLCRSCRGGRSDVNR
mmetsp:Transcript_16149/g.36958  ORF Transcript_16149/g.36958 Transcript_16149/m.36958 type:complete len:304 (-) Transcript_16149:185-1096(-)